MKAATAAMPVSTEKAAVDTVAWEKVAYAALALLAGGLRLVNLNAAPLSLTEAQQALAAFNGQALSSGGSPLWYGLNRLLFAVFGASVDDSFVRFSVAVLGTLLVLTPWLYRGRIGRVGALAAAALLALSPTLTVAARSLDGQIAVVTLAAAALGWAWRYVAERRSRDAYAAGSALGLMLISGPGALTMLVALGLGLVVALVWVMDDDERAGWRAVRDQRAVLGRAALAGGLAAVLGASTLLLNPSGVRHIPDVLTAWLGAWGSAETIGWGQAAQVLLLYEVLIVTAGLAGFIWTIRRLPPLAVVLSVWFSVAFMIALLQTGRQVFDLTLALVPLALLGGYAVQALQRELARHAAWQFEGAAWLLMGPLLGYLAVTLSAYAVGRGTVGSAQVMGLTLGPIGSFLVLAGMLALIVGAVFTIAVGAGVVLRAGAVAALVLMAVVTLGNTWSVTQLRPSDPREVIYAPVATSPDVRWLVQGAEAASIRATGHRQRASVNVALPYADPVVNWYFRHFANSTVTAAPDGFSAIMLTPVDVTPPANAGSYVGGKFTVRTQWLPLPVSDTNFLKWWVYREVTAPVAQDVVVLWVQTPQE